jgi:very-short-patch-repair endonuclease
MKGVFERTIIQTTGLTCIKEYRFHPDRKWRIDYAIDPDSTKIAIEVEGGTWIRGRHIRPHGYLSDMDKYNALASMGWRLIRVTPEQLMSLRTIQLIQSMINGNKDRQQSKELRV